jgi:hypothetical protein
MRLAVTAFHKLQRVPCTKLIYSFMFSIAMRMLQQAPNNINTFCDSCTLRFERTCRPSHAWLAFLTSISATARRMALRCKLVKKLTNTLDHYIADKQRPCKATYNYVYKFRSLTSCWIAHIAPEASATGTLSESLLPVRCSSMSIFSPSAKSTISDMYRSICCYYAFLTKIDVDPLRTYYYSSCPFSFKTPFLRIRFA